MLLTPDQRARYHRQLLLPEVGEEGQERLLSSRVLVVGAGGLGSAAAFYLAAGGVGALGIVDDGRVELSNLQRQILHTTGRVGMAKAESARLTLSALNPEVRILTYTCRLGEDNALELVSSFDVVVSALDNMETRFVLNEACVHLGKPLVEGGVEGFIGRVMTIVPGEGPCFRCVFTPRSGARPEAEAFPVFATTPGVIGVLQAQEVFKLLLGKGTPLVGRILFYDGLTGSFCEQKVNRVSTCPCCGGG